MQEKVNDLLKQQFIIIIWLPIIDKFVVDLKQNKKYFTPLLVKEKGEWGDKIVMAKTNNPLSRFKERPYKANFDGIFCMENKWTWKMQQQKMIIWP